MSFKVGQFVIKGDGTWAVYRVTQIFEGDIMRDLFRAVLVSNSKFHRAGREEVMENQEGWLVVDDPVAWARGRCRSLDLTTDYITTAPGTLREGQSMLRTAAAACAESWKPGETAMTYLDRATGPDWVSRGVEAKDSAKAWAEGAVAHVISTIDIIIGDKDDALRTLKLAAEQRA